MKQISVKITISEGAALKVLGGLAYVLKQTPQDRIYHSFELRNCISKILEQLEADGIDITDKQSPFYTYTKLVGYTSLPF
jgi:hypothetical protein